MHKNTQLLRMSQFILTKKWLLVVSKDYQQTILFFFQNIIENSWFYYEANDHVFTKFYQMGIEVTNMVN